jgi:hypothetical protein
MSQPAKSSKLASANLSFEAQTLLALTLSWEEIYKT